MALAAQVLAEVSQVADTTWVTARPPRFLPDDVDGRVLFATARARIQAMREGRDHAGVAGAGDIAMVPERAGGAGPGSPQGAAHVRPAHAIRREVGRWHHPPCDAVICCTGFRPALQHLRDLGLRTATAGSRSAARPGPRLSLSRAPTSSGTATGSDLRQPPWPAWGSPMRDGQSTSVRRL